MDALELLRNDHDKVNQLFMQFERGGGSQDFQMLFNQLYQELTIHTTIEEQIFYPAVRNNPETAGLVQQAYQEHGEAKQLLTEIAGLDNTSTDWGQKMTQLMRAIQHHVQEEEGELFVKVRLLMTPEQLDQLGAQLGQAKQQAQQAMPSNSPMMYDNPSGSQQMLS